MSSRQQKNRVNGDQTTSPKSPLICESRDLSILLLADPENPAREIFDEHKLHELCESIQQYGIIEPLIVFPDGERYRVAAGHRRLIAARAVGLETVPCRLYKNGRACQEALKHHENKFREDLNAADEAKHFNKLLEEQCNGDVDQLTALVGERRDYVEERLLLIQGDSRIFQALQDGTVNIGVARELNLVKSSARRLMYLDAAAQGGATIAMVRQWRIKGNADDAQFPGNDIAIPPTSTEDIGQRPVGTHPTCTLCGSTADQWEMEIMFVHKSCVRAQERRGEVERAQIAEQPAGA
jgi:ParB/RepB/Spo0J family partition protein